MRHDYQHDADQQVRRLFGTGISSRNGGFLRVLSKDQELSVMHAEYRDAQKARKEDRITLAEGIALVVSLFLVGSLGAAVVAF